MNGIEKLFASIRALFAPSPPPPAPREVEVTAARPASEPDVVEARAPEPVAVAERPLVEAPPPAVEMPVRAVAEPETPVEEAPAELEPIGTEGVTLRLESERGSPSMFQVTKSGATIGRGPESTIQLADLSVSRKHARIAYKQGAYWLSDLGSMGGTWIDGTKLAAPRRVAAGQTIDIGLCRLTVVAAAEAEKTGAAKGPSNAA